MRDNIESQPAAVLKGVSVTYGRGEAAVKAVDDVSLQVDRGKLTLLMGPSGSGKTTVLQILGCLRRPDAGEVYVGGRSVSDLGERELSTVRREQIGFVFQQYNLLPNLRAWENVALALELQGNTGKQIERRSRDILSRLGIDDRAEAFPGELSGGQKQRVAIARSIISSPRLILADEPTAALDATAGLNVARVLRELAEEHDRAVVVVTHDARMEPFAHNVILLEDGQTRPSVRVPEPRFVELGRRVET